MDFDIPKDVADYLKVLDLFIDKEIKPLQAQDDNERFFDHRREHARTDWENGGTPRHEWERLLAEMRRRADRAGHLRYALPSAYGGKDGTNLAVAIIREHLAGKGLGLHNDLQNESSIVGSFPTALVMRDFGTQAQKDAYLPGILDGSLYVAFALTEPNHGSDATWMETRAKRETRDGVAGWVINGEKMWNSHADVATHDLVYARTSGKDGDALGISCFIVPMKSKGVKIEKYYWTFNMPTDHAHVSFSEVFVPKENLLGAQDHGLELAQHFVHENRTRQAASSLGAARYCIAESVRYANERKPFGKPLSQNQAIQFPLVELATEAEMLRVLLYKTTWQMDRMSKPDVAKHLSDKVSMCNYRANRLVCRAADFAMQVHGGMGYSRHKPFEHIYRHHRRYRITEGTEQIQMRKIAGHLFGFMGKNRRPKADAG